MQHFWLSDIQDLSGEITHVNAHFGHDAVFGKYGNEVFTRGEDPGRGHALRLKMDDGMLLLLPLANSSDEDLNRIGYHSGRR